jgi:hypothetical protein
MSRRVTIRPLRAQQAPPSYGRAREHYVTLNAIYGDAYINSSMVTLKHFHRIDYSSRYIVAQVATQQRSVPQ